MSRTGITQLDKLLGGGLAAGSIVLLRGGPGTGKTTLALQLIHHHLRSHSEKDPCAAVFVSLELEPSLALHHVQTTYNFELGFDASKGSINLSRFLVWNRSNLHNEVFTELRDNDGIPNALGTALIRQMNVPDIKVPKKGWLIAIDSLNVLTSIIMHHRGSRETDLRQLLQGISEMAREQLDGATVVFLAEYRLDSPLPQSITSESFLCDVEILLSHEPIANHFSAIHPTPRTGHFHATRLFRDGANTPQAIETRSFCRIVKARMAAAQSRRCTYDIVRDRGLVFYETYPGDGCILLFAENEPQEQTWDDFFSRDVPHNYPALRFERFDRSALQRTFASQRGFRNRPSRTDLYLASIDTYWVRWYLELCQKWDIAALWQKQITAAGSRFDPATFATLVANIHSMFIDRLSRGADCPAPQDVRKSVGDSLRRLGPDGDKLNELLIETWKYLTSNEGQGGLLQPIPVEELRLFGELRSGIIAELDRRDTRSCDRQAPVHRMDDIPRCSPFVRCVPYNANLSFLVHRQDKITRVLSDQNRGDIQSKLRKLYDDECVAFGDRMDMPPCDDHQMAIFVDELFRRKYPSTWEELIVLCQQGSGYFLIETLTFDTLLCTFLEILWGCGGDLIVSPAYEVRNRKHTVCCLTQALWLLMRMFVNNIIPQNCSLEAEQLAQINPHDGKSTLPRDWLFARHWHSTFIDTLTRKGRGDQFIWQPADQMELGVAELPIGMAQRLRDPNAKHSSCWGEWHFGVVAGSENEALACDLINNLMSSQKVCERTFRVPRSRQWTNSIESTVSEDALIFRRTNIKTPAITFAEFRRLLFGSARFRSEVFDYRHCMRNIHALLELVHHTSAELSVQAIEGHVISSVERIEGLCAKGVLQT